MSATMAEKLINESQKNPSQIQHRHATHIGPASTSAASKNTISELESVLINRQSAHDINPDTSSSLPSKKPPNGGVRCLPFPPPVAKKATTDTTASTPSNNSAEFSAVQHRYELKNSSKSKRPISSQLQELPIPSSPNSSASTPQQSGTRHAVLGFLPIKQTATNQLSSFNENLCQSEDEADTKKDSAENKTSVPSSREKTPDMFQNELANALQRNNKLLPSNQPADESSLSKSPIDANEIGVKRFLSQKSTDQDVNAVQSRDV